MARLGGVCAALVATLVATFLVALPPALGAGAASPGEGVYEDPLGRYRFSFTGTWRVASNEENAAALDHFYLVQNRVVAAEFMVSSRPFPSANRLHGFVDDEVAALDAEPGLFRVSLRRDLRVDKQLATCLIARRVEQEETGARRETLLAQYWFAKGGQLWSLLLVTTPAEERRSKLLERFEKTVIAGFEVLEPDEVVQAVAASKKTVRLGNGLAAITLPERWTLLSTEDDLLVADFDKGRVYLFAVIDQELGETLDEIAHAFLNQHEALSDVQVRLETDCDLRGTPGYCLIFTGTKEGRAFTVQLITVTKGPNAFFLYGIAESNVWALAQPWITAVQYTVELVGKETDGDSATSDSAAGVLDEAPSDEAGAARVNDESSAEAGGE